VPEYRSPRAAGWFSVLPGLGLLYLGQYLKALVVALVMVGTIQFADHSDAGGLLVPLVWVGQIIYAVQEARRLNRLRAGQASPSNLEAAPAPAEEGDSPVWGGVLIGLGALFLLDQFDVIRFSEIFAKFWPLLIIGLGVQILLRARRKDSGLARS
jgi:TM2 domain-containing membrane protein YozV